MFNNGVKVWLPDLEYQNMYNTKIMPYSFNPEEERNKKLAQRQRFATVTSRENPQEQIYIYM
jgi:hypothetical protein